MCLKGLRNSTVWRTFPKRIANNNGQLQSACCILRRQRSPERRREWQQQSGKGMAVARAGRAGNGKHGRHGLCPGAVCTEVCWLTQKPSMTFVITKEGDPALYSFLCHRIFLVTFLHNFSFFSTRYLPSVIPFYKSYSIMKLRLLHLGSYKVGTAVNYLHWQPDPGRSQDAILEQRLLKLIPILKKRCWRR